MIVVHNFFVYLHPTSVSQLIYDQHWGSLMAIMFDNNKVMNMKRKISFFVTFMFVFSVLMAQPDTEKKKVTQITGSDICWNLSYSENGLMTSIVDNSENGPELLWSYNYYSQREGLLYVLQYGYYNADYVHYQDSPFYRTSTLNSDNLISFDSNGNNYMWSTGEDFEYEYNEGRLIKMTGNSGIVIDLSWTEGNLEQIVFLEGGKEEGRITCSYTDIPAKGVCQAFNSPLMLLLNYYTMQSLGPLAHGYYGLLSQDLLSEMTISFSEKFIKEHYVDYEPSTNGYPITNKKSRKYTYESDSDGNITSISVSEEGNDRIYNLKYGYTDKKCATPTIEYNKRALFFSCETPGAEYIYNIKCMDAQHYHGWNNSVYLKQTYKIRVQATLDGYQNSDVAVTTIEWRNGQPVMEGFNGVTLDTSGSNGDMNGDGVVNAADIVMIVNKIMGK